MNTRLTGVLGRIGVIASLVGLELPTHAQTILIAGTGALDHGNSSVVLGHNAAGTFKDIVIGSDSRAHGYGVAIGWQLVAQLDGVAVGTGGVAGQFAVSIGFLPTSSNHSVAIGYIPVAHSRSVAIGDGAVALDDAVAIGAEATTALHMGLSLGYNSHADESGVVAGNFGYAAQFAAAFGPMSRAAGSSSVALGSVVTAEASSATAVGTNVGTFGRGSVAIGSDLYVASESSVLLGQRASHVRRNGQSPSMGDAKHQQDVLFGVGAGDVSARNIFTVYRDGVARFAGPVELPVAGGGFLTLQAGASAGTVSLPSSGALLSSTSSLDAARLVNTVPVAALPADVSRLGAAIDLGSSEVAGILPWSKVGSKPTTVAGYGITDALAVTRDGAGRISSPIRVLPQGDISMGAFTNGP